MKEIIKLTNIYKSFGKKEVLKGASFSLFESEMLGIEGESGCGKSTLMNIALGLIKEDQGSKETCEDFSARLIYQNPWSSLDPAQTIGDGLFELLMVHRIGKNKEETKSLIYDMLKKCGLGQEVLVQRPMSISGGEAARVCLARALFAKPKMLVMDEACSMLDEDTALEIIELSKDLICGQGGGIVFVSHDKELLSHCDRVLRFNNGKLE